MSSYSAELVVSSSSDMPQELGNLSLLLNETNDFSSGGVLPDICKFQGITQLNDIIDLVQSPACHRHSLPYTVFLCVANLLILTFGLLGNSMVVYLAAFKMKTRTASSIFIANLAFADLLVIIFCIPTTLVTNLFKPWVMGEIVCKVAPYAQGVSVFCSVYSLVAISFDRFRAIHNSWGIAPNISTLKALKISILIWTIGLAIIFPWAMVFSVQLLKIDKAGNKLPFCMEIWPSKSQDTLYFLLVNVTTCYVLPLGVIIACNVIIWQNVLSTQSSSHNASSSSRTTTTALCLATSSSWLVKVQRQRRIRVLKMFTGLTFVFFVCWLPLYLLMGRVKLFYTDTFTGGPTEQFIMSLVIPAAQLLGSCNSCVNPVLYALLNQKFRKNFKRIFGRLCRPTLQNHLVLTAVGTAKRHSVGVIVAGKVGIGTTAV